MNRKQIYKKLWFWIIVILVIVGINGAINGSRKKADTIAKQETTVSENKNIEDNTKDAASNVDLSSRWNEDNTFKLDSKSNTDEAEMEMYNKAKEDVNKFEVASIPKVINFIKADSINPWKDNASMERMIYFGTVLANSKYTTESEKQVGDKAKSTVSYVYRGKETTDEAKKTQAALTKLIKKLK